MLTAEAVKKASSSLGKQIYSHPEMLWAQNRMMLSSIVEYYRSLYSIELKKTSFDSKLNVFIFIIRKHEVSNIIVTTHKNYKGEGLGFYTQKIPSAHWTIIIIQEQPRRNTIQMKCMIAAFILWPSNLLSYFICLHTNWTSLWWIQGGRTFSSNTHYTTYRSHTGGMYVIFQLLSIG